MNVGYVAIAGKPNVGKSTLLNAMLGTKLSIVSVRPQTTRQRVLGIDSGPGHQIVFLDTPGLLEPKYAMQAKLLAIAGASIKESDLLLFLLDAVDGLKAEDEAFFKAYRKKKTIIVVNKIDLVTKEALLPLIARVHQATGIEDIHPISALSKFGVAELRNGIIKQLPQGEPFYDADSMTDQPEQFFVAEIIREKIFEQFGAEIPYSTAVVIDDFKEQEGRKDVIRATIWVEKASQKAMVIGTQGRKLKAVGSAARIDIEKLLERPVYLELWVKVREKWRRKEGDLRELGL
jgi:GTP-binding protein Era